MLERQMRHLSLKENTDFAKLFYNEARILANRGLIQEAEDALEDGDQSLKWAVKDRDYFLEDIKGELTAEEQDDIDWLRSTIADRDDAHHEVEGRKIIFSR